MRDSWVRALGVVGSTGGCLSISEVLYQDWAPATSKEGQTFGEDQFALRLQDLTSRTDSHPENWSDRCSRRDSPRISQRLMIRRFLRAAWLAHHDLLLEGLDRLVFD